MTTLASLEKWQAWLKEATNEELYYYIEVYEDAIKDREERNLTDRLGIIRMETELRRRISDATKGGQQV